MEMGERIARDNRYNKSFCVHKKNTPPQARLQPVAGRTLGKCCATSNILRDKVMALLQEASAATETPAYHDHDPKARLFRSPLKQI